MKVHIAELCDSHLMALLLLASLVGSCHKEPPQSPPVHKHPPPGMTELAPQVVTVGTKVKNKFWMTKFRTSTHDKGLSYRKVPKSISTHIGARDGTWYFLIPSIPTQLDFQWTRLEFGRPNVAWGSNWVVFNIDNATDQSILLYAQYAEGSSEDYHNIQPRTMVSVMAQPGNHLLRFLDADGKILEAAYVWISPRDKPEESPTYFYNIFGANTYTVRSAYYSDRKSSLF